jgi:hypothetical protein
VRRKLDSFQHIAGALRRTFGGIGVAKLGGVCDAKPRAEQQNGVPEFVGALQDGPSELPHEPGELPRGVRNELRPAPGELPHGADELPHGAGELPHGAGELRSWRLRRLPQS